jgi:hypothetical protein
MIPVFLWTMRWRLLLVAVFCVGFFLLEEAFHFHGEPTPDTPIELLDPAGIALTVANVAGSAMLVFLAGFVSTDRRRGYYRMYFSHPTRPLAYYGVRWLLSYALAVSVAALFLVFSQLVAWGELRVGAGAMVQPALLALVYGGLMAFLSVVVPWGDSFIALSVFLVYWLWRMVLDSAAMVGARPIPDWINQLFTFVLPPYLALEGAFTAWTLGTWAWDAIAYAVGYGVFWLVLAALLLRLREWP